MDPGVEFGGVRRGHDAQGHQDPRRQPRPEAGAVRGLERAGESDAGDGLLDVGRAEAREFGGEQPLEPLGAGGEEPEGFAHSGRLYRRISSELLTTLTELNAIAAPPIIGLSRKPSL